MNELIELILRHAKGLLNLFISAHVYAEANVCDCLTCEAFREIQKTYDMAQRVMTDGATAQTS